MSSHRFAIATLVLAASTATAMAQRQWKIHDMDRPQPKVIDPASPSTQAEAGRPPSDAVVLFDGKDLSKWQAREGGGPAKWKVENGYMETFKGAGYIATRESFGDCQLHVEFRTPVPATGESQARGNSGVFLMSLYEIQVLDSYENKTYADGAASAVYGQYPPQVNASRRPGEWQTYDIVFHAPRFDGAGKVTRPARATVLHNGVLVQDNVELVGPTANKVRLPYKAHPDKLPLALQDHGNPVRFRNIWIREIAAEPPPVPVP
jgi:hypothetical protein